MRTAPVVQRLLKKNSEPLTGARPSVRLCVGPELARCVHKQKTFKSPPMAHQLVKEQRLRPFRTIGTHAKKRIAS